MIKRYIILLLIIFFVSFFFLGCDKENKYTIDEWEQIQEQEQRQVQEKERLSEKQKKIEDYLERLDELYNYINEITQIKDKYLESISNLIDKFNNETDNLDKKATYSELLAEKYDNWLKDISAMEVPEFLIDSYNYELESLNKSKLQFNNFAERVKYKQYNSEDDFDELSSESNIAHIKSQKEFDIITKKFSKEAEELGLAKPFLDK